jgi:hypothetical protein
MLVAGCRELPGAGGWAYEVKFDGMRAQLRVERERVVVYSRPGRDCTSEFQELGEIGEVLSRRRLLLDGELVCLASDFQRLRARLGRHPSRTSRLTPAPATELGRPRPLPQEESTVADRARLYPIRRAPTRARAAKRALLARRTSADRRSIRATRRSCGSRRGRARRRTRQVCAAAGASCVLRAAGGVGPPAQTSPP